jgi:hypothetical protein
MGPRGLGAKKHCAREDNSDLDRQRIVRTEELACATVRCKVCRIVTGL